MLSANAPLRPLAIAPMLLRWQSLMFLYLLLMAAIAPALFHGDDAFDVLFTVDNASQSDANALIAVLLLQGTALAALMAGMLVMGLVNELLGTASSWTIPSARPSLAVGHVLVMLVLVAAHATWATLRAGSTIGVAAAVMTPLWYSVGMSVSLVLAKPRVIAPAILLLLVALFRKSWYVPFVLEWLPAAAIVSLTYTAVLTYVIGSRAWGRTEIALRRAAAASGPMLSLPFGVGKRAKPSAAVELASRPDERARKGLLDWIRAAVEESSFAGGKVWFIATGVTVAILFAFNYFLGTSLAILGVSLGRHGLQLSGRVMMPLSRHDRAKVQFWCGVIEALFLFGTAALFYAALTAFTLPRPALLSSNALSGAAGLLGLLACVAFAPFAQLPRALGRVVTERPFYRIHEYFVTTTVFMISAEALPRMFVSRLGDSSLLPPALAIIALGVVVHACHWLIVRRSFARRDLVSPLGAQ